MPYHPIVVDEKKEFKKLGFMTFLWAAAAFSRGKIELIDSPLCIEHHY